MWTRRYLCKTSLYITKIRLERCGQRHLDIVLMFFTSNEWSYKWKSFELFKICLLTSAANLAQFEYYAKFNDFFFYFSINFGILKKSVGIGYSINYGYQYYHVWMLKDGKSSVNKADIMIYFWTGNIVCVEGKHAVQGTFVIKARIVVISHLLVLVNLVHVNPQLQIIHGEKKSKSNKIICNTLAVHFE